MIVRGHEVVAQGYVASAMNRVLLFRFQLQRAVDNLHMSNKAALLSTL